MSRYRIVSISVLAGGILAVAPLAGLGEDRPNAGVFAGTWRVVVQPSGGSPVINFASATMDGRIINTDPGGTGVGEWKRISGPLHGVTFHGFQTTGGQTFRVKVRGQVTLGATGTQFAGPFVTDVSDLSGTPLFSVQGVVTATRLEVEPL